MGEVNMKSKTKTAIVLLVILALIVVYFVIPRVTLTITLPNMLMQRI